MKLNDLIGNIYTENILIKFIIYNSNLAFY